MAICPNVTGHRQRSERQQARMYRVISGCSGTTEIDYVRMAGHPEVETGAAIHGPEDLPIGLGLKAKASVSA